MHRDHNQAEEIDEDFGTSTLRHLVLRSYPWRLGRAIYYPVPSGESLPEAVPENHEKKIAKTRLLIQKE